MFLAKLNVRSSSYEVLDVAKNQKNVGLLMTFWECADRNERSAVVQFLNLCVALKRFMRSDGINQLWNNKYKILWACLGILSSVTRHAIKIFSVPNNSNLSPVRLYRIFPHYPINCTIFENKLFNMKCVFWFSQ